MTPDHPGHIGKYEVLGVIGQGAMGTVYKATQPSLDQVVAIKVLPEEFREDPDRVERFDREAQAVALLNHPNVVHIIEQGEDEGRAYFVMEYVPGASLAEIMQRRRLSLPETLMVFKQVCHGLEAAHGKDVIHRDLNPHNILVSEDLRLAKITDFGISRVERISQERGTLSTSAVSLGTLHYMAPEQSANMVETDHRSDIYSAGVLLYEMLTGRVPVGRFNLPSQINSDVPPEFDPIVLKCLETNPRERYASVASLLQAVVRLENQLRLGLASDLRGLKASTSKIFDGSTRTLKKKKVVWSAIAVLIFIAGGVATAILVRMQGEPEVSSAAAPTRAETVLVSPTEQYARAERSEVAGIDLDNAPEAPVDDSEEQGLGADLVGTRDAAANADAEASGPEAAPRVADASAKDLAVIQAKIDAALYGPALEDLGAFIEANSSGGLLSRARLMKAKVLQLQALPEEAKAAYVEVLTRHRRAAEAAEAGHQLGVLLLAERGREKVEEARRVFGRVAEDHPRSIWAPLSLAAKAEAEKDARIMVMSVEFETRVPAAMATWRSLVEAYPRHSEAEQAWLDLGGEYEDLKQFERAAEAYLGLARNFPGSRLEPWWKAGQIYDRKLDRKDLAREAYASVPESSRHYRDAQKRLGKL